MPMHGMLKVDPRDRLALALDVDDLVVAERLASELRPWFGVAKVGLELYTRGRARRDRRVARRSASTCSLDLKLHDIPTTVGRASGCSARWASSYLNLHAAGGARHAARRRRGTCRGRERRRARGADRARRSRCSRATPTRRPTSCEASGAGRRSPGAAASCARRPTSRRQSRRRRSSIAVVPGIRPAGGRRTIRRGPRRRPRRSRGRGPARHRAGGHRQRRDPVDGRRWSPLVRSPSRPSPSTRARVPACRCPHALS